MNPELTHRSGLFATGREICNGFSELNDPEDQAARFQTQTKAKGGGDEEVVDDNYLGRLTTTMLAG